MNDLVLTSLLNLFALFGASSQLERESAKEIIYNYLARYFGVKKYEDYLSLYDTLRDVYEMSPDLDKDQIITKIIGALHKKIHLDEQVLLALRFMEFSSNNKKAYLENKALFHSVAKLFSVSDAMFSDFCKYVEGEKSKNIAIFQPEGLTGFLKILRIKEINKMILTYEGEEQIYMNEVPMVNGIFVLWQQSGIVKSMKMDTVYYDYIHSLFEKDKEYEQIQLCGRDVNFCFPNSNNGLHNFSFDLQSGQIIAIMGGSGVGKSTLLSILNGTLKPQSGSITLNGESLYGNSQAVKDRIGFVPQDDLLIEELTVYDNLFYTACFCFDKISIKEIHERVNHLLSDLDLLYIKDLKVGSPLNKTISGGQRKRLNIALELIREPSVLYLDEPTSGLSSADSEKVLNLLKAQTFKGKLIVVNIHQPSSDIYKLFDRLWLLDTGGYPVYDGNPIEAISYFKEYANYADAESATCLTCGNVNPEVVLNIIDAKALNNSGELTLGRKVSPLEWHQWYVDNRPQMNEPQKISLAQTEQKKPNVFKQFAIYFRRNLKAKLSDKQFLLISLLEAPVLAAILSLLTHYVGEEGYSIMDNKNLLSYFFMAIIVSIFMGMSMAAEDIFKDRSLLKREKFLRLNYGSYISSKITFCAGLSLVQTLLFILVGNSIAGIHDLFLVWWLILFSSAFLSNLIGLLLSQTLNSIVSIYVTIPLLLIPQILLCGLVVPFSDLTQSSKSNNVPIIGDVIPSRWAYEALAVTAFSGNKYNKKFFENESKQYQLQFCRIAYIGTMDKSLEKAFRAYNNKDPHFDKEFPMLRNEIQQLSERWNLRPFPNVSQLNRDEFNESLYDDLNCWLEESNESLYQRSLRYSNALDRQKKEYIKEFGLNSLIQEKKQYYNKNLETVVLNLANSSMSVVREDVIVPQVGAAYLEPISTNGRAPFYSHVKKIGDWQIPTLYFNLAVLWFMSLLVGVALFFDFPGRLLRKE
ncbi:MAG: ATP-binding cassette domain-containing protein [Phocaeicola sp.]